MIRRVEPEAPSDDVSVAEQQLLDDDLCVHVFSAAANMLAVCLALTGLFRIVKQLRGSAVAGESVLLVAAFAFLVASMTSYFALRTRTRRRRYRAERIADLTFLLGMCLLAIVCVMIAVEIL
jgi:heme/copper-type cytochrome/quinol oxidase subunit 3